MENEANGPVLVTGAGAGIGRAVVDRLLADGREVLAWDRDADALREPFHREDEVEASVQRHVVDVSDAPEVRRTMTLAINKSPTLSAIVNCAGAVATSHTEKEWEEVLATNLMGCRNVVEAALGYLGPGSAIVNVSSLSAAFGGARMAAYSASKAGLEAYTRVLAVELAPRGIRVNAVAPGWIATESNMPNPDHSAFTGYLKRCPLARAGEPGEVAAAISFLLSDQASYITGQVLVVDGGWSISM
jgi:3-oxoacyl-[acyl-carrier protein] reductase